MFSGELWSSHSCRNFLDGSNTRNFSRKHPVREEVFSTRLLWPFELIFHGWWYSSWFFYLAFLVVILFYFPSQQHWKTEIHAVSISWAHTAFPVSRNYKGNGWMSAELVAGLYNGCIKPHDFVTLKLLNRSSCNRSALKQHVGRLFFFLSALHPWKCCRKVTLKVPVKD